MFEPGRIHPHDYSYDRWCFDRPPDLAAEVLYVVGGLYGKLAALDALEALIAAEGAPTTVVFNGDFHWFDAQPSWFMDVEGGLASYRCIRGNVETELARVADIGAGCGCAYPASVDDDTVRRSSRILEALRATAARLEDVRERLWALPAHLVADVTGVRVGIVVLHGRVRVDALALPYDAQAFLQRFLQRWPPGSAAHRSYFHRIVAGPDACVAHARPRALAWSETA